MINSNVDRRTVLLGAAVVAGTAAVAGCSSSASKASGAAASSSPESTALGTAIGSIAPKPAAGAGAKALGKTSDIAVGGGKIYAAARVVVTQPTAGDFKAFTAVCTHQGCLVATISGDQIQCPCHGSSYSIKDGSVINGPATAPLKAEPLTVAGGSFTLA